MRANPHTERTLRIAFATLRGWLCRWFFSEVDIDHAREVPPPAAKEDLVLQ